MALDKAALTSALKAVFIAGYPIGTVKTGSVQETQMNNLATGIANAIDAYLTSADVMYETNLTSATGGAVTAVDVTKTIAKLQ